MTVENSVSKTPKLVMGAKTYDFNFDVLLEDPTTEDAKRAIKCAISDGTTETELIYGTDYTVTLNSDKKGGVVTVTDVKDDRWHIVIYRQYNMTQGVDLNDYNEFPAETIERAFDKQTMLIQELKEIAERSVKVTPANNQTPEELLDEVYSKLDSATEVATNAIAAATLATTAAESATKAVEEAEQQVQEVTQYIDDKKVEIDGIVVDAQNSVDGAIQQAVEDVKQAAVNEAESVIQDAGQTATNIAVEYVNTTVKPELQGISDNAQQYATNAKASQEAAKVSETNAKTAETNAKIWAEGSDNSVSALGGTHSSKRWNELCSDLKASTQLSEQNAKRYAESINPDNLLNTQMITNCLTHIPQDIKLELVDGTLTLKAGSKVYVPNGKNSDGSLKFDVVVVESDLSETGFGTETRKMFVCYREGVIDLDHNSISGTSTPSGSGFFYNTNTNKIDYVSNGSLLNRQYSFPLAIVTFVDSTIVSLDQTFNGFGYIGSTVFVLPGVRGLIPDGRNEDGTLRNIEHTIHKVLTIDFPGTPTRWIFIVNKNNDGLSCPEEYFYISKTQPAVINQTQVWYNPSTNEMFYSNWQNTSTFKKNAGFCYLTLNYPTNTSISDFNPKTTFQAVDRNDSSWLSGLGMPSNRYIDLTLGASGSKYTAPANGWVVINKKGGVEYAYISLIQDPSIIAQYRGIRYDDDICGVIPVRKGNFSVQYNATGTTNRFRFIYAEGEK